MKEVYEKLEPFRYTKLELNNFHGVYLKYDDCVLIVRKLVELEMDLKKAKDELR